MQQRYLVLCDIDGTIADSSLDIHPRNRAEWERRLSERIRPFPMALHALQDVARRADIAFVSGRPQYTEPLTRAWLRRHVRVTWRELHLCPLGIERDAHKAAVLRQAERARPGRVCLIDDAYRGPGLVFRAPAGWAQLLRHLDDPGLAQRGLPGEDQVAGGIGEV